MKGSSDDGQLILFPSMRRVADLREFLDASTDPDVIAGLAMALLDHIEDSPGAVENMTLTPPTTKQHAYVRLDSLPPCVLSPAFCDRLQEPE